MPVLNATPPANQLPGSAELLRILKIELPIIVKLAERKVNVHEVLRLGLGSIIEFFKPSDEPLQLMINNKTIALGVTVKIGENFGIKLTQVGDTKSLIAAMGGRKPAQL